MSSRGLKKKLNNLTGYSEYTVDSYKERCFQWRFGLRKRTFENDDGKNPSLSVVCMQYAEVARLDYRYGISPESPEELYSLARALGWSDPDDYKKAEEIVDHFFQENPFAKTWNDTRRQGLLLIGGCGTGKTYMAAAIANELCEDKCNTVMVQYDELREYMADDDNYSDEDIIGCYLDSYFETGVNAKNGGILIIDDLFSRTDKKAMDFALRLFDMMTTTSDSYPMVVTANLTKEELINPSPEKARIISRLRELCTVVETGTQDRRSLILK